jgi:hypothetical protein
MLGTSIDGISVSATVSVPRKSTYTNEIEKNASTWSQNVIRVFV